MSIHPRSSTSFLKFGVFFGRSWGRNHLLKCLDVMIPIHPKIVQRPFCRGVAIIKSRVDNFSRHDRASPSSGRRKVSSEPRSEVTKIVNVIQLTVPKDPGSRYVLRKGFPPNQSYDLGMGFFDHQSYERW